MRTLKEFNKNTSKRTGIQSHCKYCQSDYFKKFRVDPETQRRRRIKSEYGITIDQYEEMYKSSDGRCYICGDFHPQLCIDHCHGTGRVRGLLCSTCNRGLGHFKDNVFTMQSAIDYLLN